MLKAWSLSDFITKILKMSCSGVKDYPDKKTKQTIA